MRTETEVISLTKSIAFQDEIFGLHISKVPTQPPNPQRYFSRLVLCLKYIYNLEQ